jgi:hypothetical protein
MRQTALRTWSWLAVLTVGLGLLAGTWAPADQPGGKDKEKAAKPSEKKEAPTGEHPRLEMFPGIEQTLKRLEQIDPMQAAQLRRVLEQAQQQLTEARRLQEQALEQARKARAEAEQTLQRHRQEMARRFQEKFPPPFPGRMPVRLGIWPLPPDPVLRDQLDLPKGQGLVVADVLPDTPAAKAGLKKHDILLELEGKPVPSNPEEFREQLSKIKPGTKVDLVILRKGKREKISGVVLADGSDGPPGPPPRREVQPQDRQSSRPGGGWYGRWRRLPLLLAPRSW